jgi:hypothetical protein
VVDLLVGCSRAVGLEQEQGLVGVRWRQQEGQKPEGRVLGP